MGKAWEERHPPGHRAARNCARKKRYESEERAERALIEVGSKKGPEAQFLHTYSCTLAPDGVEHWHLGNDRGPGARQRALKKQEKQRRKQLVREWLKEQEKVAI